jgi:MobA/MobL family/Phage integrase family
MAIYLLQVKTFGRARGGRATREAAYRAGERIRDERTREVYNWSKRNDVVLKEIALPSQFSADAALDWARDRATLWNAAEQTNRRNACLAREVLVLLPPELTPAQRAHLVRRFAQELADRHQNAVDATIHLPRPGADKRHHHAHFLTTTRQVTPGGLGPRTTWDLSGMERYARGLGPSKGELLFVRERWAEVTNEALRHAGLTTRVDHRGLRARRINQEPVPELLTALVVDPHIQPLASGAGLSLRSGAGPRARRSVGQYSYASDMRHLAGTLMSEAGVPPRRAQEILGHADVRTTLGIYIHAMKRKRGDSTDRMAELAGLAPGGKQRGNKWLRKG